MARVLSNIIYAICIVVIALSFFIDGLYSFRVVAIFTLVGAFTNDIAIFMIFTKIPFVYGSGIIEIKFLSIKQSISNLVIKEFFSDEQIDKFKHKMVSESKDKINSSKIYTLIKEAIMSSSFAPMLSMVGGEAIIDKQKDHFITKIEENMGKLNLGGSFDIETNVKQLIKDRVDELTPAMVKKIIKEIIKEHLSWLVLWGGIIGFIVGIVNDYI